jgi:nitrite reductase/ring-hydroxylating ferredoxin subunit
MDPPTPRRNLCLGVALAAARGVNTTPAQPAHMSGRHRLTSVDTVEEEGSWLFTGRDQHGNDEEFFLVPCDTEAHDASSPHDDDPDRSPVEAWLNRCTHEDQRLYREGVGAVLREGGVVCPKHGSIFDACSGYCDNGEAADTSLPSANVDVEDGQVYLVDDDIDFLHAGPSDDDDDDDGPSSTSHLQL